MVAAAMDKGKKQKVEERENEEDDEIVLIALEKLHGYQEELEKINEEASEQVLAIEQKFNAIKKPVYEKRHETINTIPDFWLTAFLNHPALGDLVSDEDQKIFRYLSSLEVDDFTDVKTGYSISLVFKPNPFFEDVKLTKTFTFGDEGATKITATKIKWKEGMGLPNGVADEKKGSKRPPSDERECSFFTWFTETEFKNDLDDFQDDIAEIIKDDLWPNPLNYFNNDGEDDEFEDEEGDEAEDGSDSQEEDDDDEDDE